MASATDRRVVTLLSSFLLAASLTLALLPALPGLTGMAPSVGGGAGVSGEATDLPPAAEAAISSRLGRDFPAYHARATAIGPVLADPGGSLRARFAPDGVHVSSGSAAVGLSLRLAGRGDALTPVAPAVPATTANRAAYDRGTLVEWYANGPFGLEQGFTISRPPGVGGGPLALEMAIRGVDRIQLGDRSHDARLATGGGAITYSGIWAADAAGTPLPAHLETEGDRLRIVVDDSGARYPLTVDPVLSSAKLTASDRLAGDNFGFSIAVSGGTVVVGARNDDVGANSNQGSAYVFERPVNGWVSGTQVAKLTASDGTADDRFGAAVAIDGDTIVVGANQLGEAGQVGAAYVFVKPMAGWVDATQTAKLTPSDGAAQDAFGHAVAIESSTIYISSPGAQIGANPAGGAVYVYEEPMAGWINATQTAKLTESAGFDGQLGAGLAVSGDTLVAGVPAADAPDFIDEGVVAVFERPQGGWVNGTESTFLVASDGEFQGQLGDSVDIDGDTVVAGSAFADHDNNSIINGGAVYVFVEPQGGWSSGANFKADTGKLIASDRQSNDRLGFFVAVDGDTVIAGANQDDVGPNPNVNQGSVYVWTEPPSGWADATERFQLVAADGDVPDGLGASVALNGEEVYAGAAGDDSGAGSAYFFQIDTVPPDTTIDTGPAEGSRTSQHETTFTFSGVPPSDTAGFICRLDNEVEVNCDTGGVIYSVATDGPHTLFVWAVDASGNRDPTPATRTWTIDSTPPDTAVEGGPAGSTSDPTPTFTFTATELGATFTCSVDTGTPTFGPCSGPSASHTPPTLAPGTYTFRVRATDDLGNTDATPATRAFTVTAENPPPPVVRCDGLRATKVGTNGPNRIRGTAKRDVIVGKGGNDTLIGLGADDVLCGNGGRDTLKGGPGRDRLLGGGGPDKLIGGPGKDTLKGGPGRDIERQ